MPTICEIDGQGFWTGQALEISELDGAPAGWVFGEAPEPGADEAARWTGAGWAIVPAAAAQSLRFAAAREALLDRLADRRWRAETGGTAVDGVTIATDRESAAFLTAAYVTAKEDPDYSIRWKAGRAQFATLDAATIIAMATLARAHVQACFDREDQLTAQVLAVAEGDLAALAAIDIEQGWPE